jgi:electron transport complex protein RnfG
MPAHATEYLTVEQAQKVLFPGATDFTKKSVDLSEADLQKIKDQAGVKQRNKNPDIWSVQSKGKKLGYFFIDDVVGKHEFITYAVAVNTVGEVQGIEILNYRETHGGEIRQDSWKKNFKGKKVTDPFKLDQDVPNITGATLSCRNVLDGVKRILTLYQILENEKAI